MSMFCAHGYQKECPFCDLMEEKKMGPAPTPLPPGAKKFMGESIRKFDSGATRSSDAGKPDYEGFFSPLVLRAYGEYMHKHRKQADGNIRDSDNWQKGIPKDILLKSLIRHVVDLWRMHDLGVEVLNDEEETKTIDDQLVAIIFNAQGYLYNRLRGLP